MKLYSYWRSTTSFRVRVALNLKGLDYATVPVDLASGEQLEDAYGRVNPSRGVPSLLLEDGAVLTQSLAILHYLEAMAPEPPLLPSDPLARAQVEAASQVIALDIHPVNNLRVLTYLRDRLDHGAEDAEPWMRHWMHEGFSAFQALIRPDTKLCFGDRPDLADICLAGQMINARRWGLDLSPFLRLVEIDDRLRALPAFDRAMPENQPDAA